MGRIVGGDDYVVVKQRHATFRLSPEVIAQHTAGQVVCLDHRADGRVFRLHSERPGAHLNRIAHSPLGAGSGVTTAVNGPALTIVEIRGVLEQRAGYHDYCGGWTDGHDAIAERLIAAFGDGDVVLVIDSPGGAHAGLEEALKRAQKAKAETGRIVYVEADEQIGSAAFWWAVGIADEIYTPNCGVIGSIGARSAHGSIAGKLKKAGVEIEYFVWPGDGKVAFAPEMPLSDIGRERGNRDVSLAGEAFSRAVEVGRGLTREQIMALDADCLTGQAAVDAGLADGVASLEDVIAHAIANSLDKDEPMATKQGARTEDEKPDNEGDDPEERDMGDDPEERDEDEEDEGDEPEPDANAEPDPEDEDDEPEERDEDDDDPEERDEDDEPEPGAKARARTSRRRVRTNGTSIAKLLGLSANSSQLAVKTEVRRVMSVMRSTMAALEVDTMSSLVGTARAVADDARQVAGMRNKVRKTRKQSNARRRTELAKKLVRANLDGFTRGEVYVDTVSDAGKKVTRLAPEYQEMRLKTFEAFVNRKVSSAGPRARRAGNPFSADRVAVKGAKVSLDIAESMKSTAVQNAIKNSITGTDPKLYAETHARMFGSATASDPAI